MISLGRYMATEESKIHTINSRRFGCRNPEVSPISTTKRSQDWPRAVQECNFNISRAFSRWSTRPPSILTQALMSLGLQSFLTTVGKKLRWHPWRTGISGMSEPQYFPIVESSMSVFGESDGAVTREMARLYNGARSPDPCTSRSTHRAVDADSSVSCASPLIMICDLLQTSPLSSARFLSFLQACHESLSGDSELS
jgi:hypothetical protein